MSAANASLSGYSLSRIPIYPPAPVIQTKLAINTPGDAYEQEADQVADRVMRMPEPRLQRKCACGGTCSDCQKGKSDEEHGRLQLKPVSGSAQSQTEAPHNVHEVLRSPGQPLDAATRSFMEPRFGRDFSNVRVHSGSAAQQSARDVNALAYTSGHNIVFGAGQYMPGTGTGNRLLAHELAHVLQQSGPSGNWAGGLPENTPGSLTNAAGRVDPDLGNRSPSRSGGTLAMIQRMPAPPTRQGTTGVQDPARMTVDAVPDFVASTLTARDVHAHINDPNVTHISWEIYDPTDHLAPGSFSTLPGGATATTAPFRLDPANFSGPGFMAGTYILRCVGRNAAHLPIVYADRDFNALAGDLTTGTAVTNTQGALTFTQYQKTDANPPSVPRYSVDVQLSFLPDASVTCAGVAFIQSMQTIDSQGRSQQNTVNAGQDARKTPLFWSIDRVAGAPSPFYIADTDAAGARVDNPGWGAAGHGGHTPASATLIDQPSWNHENSARFESCAVCRSGRETGKVFGCATWGYSATAAGAVTLMPRSFHNAPSEQFEAARAGWNTWRGAQPQATRPDEVPVLTRP